MLSADLLQRLDISSKVLDLVDVEVRPLIKMLTGEEASTFQMMGIRFKVSSMLQDGSASQGDPLRNWISEIVCFGGRAPPDGTLTVRPDRGKLCRQGRDNAGDEPKQALEGFGSRSAVVDASSFALGSIGCLTDSDDSGYGHGAGIGRNGRPPVRVEPYWGR